MELREAAETMSLDGRSGAPPLPDLSDRQKRTVFYAALFPNLLISAHPDYVMVLFTDPLGKKMLVGAIIMQVLGALVIRKIVNIKV